MLRTLSAADIASAHVLHEQQSCAALLPTSWAVPISLGQALVCAQESMYVTTACATHVVHRVADGHACFEQSEVLQTLVVANSW